MISTLGVILLIIYLILFVVAIACKRVQTFKLDVLIGCISVSLFVNVGNFFLNFSFTEVGCIVCIVTSIIAWLVNRVKHIYVEKKCAYWFTFMICVMLVGLLHLRLSNNMPDVLSMDINMDQAYYGMQYAKKASLSVYNWIAFRDLILFSVVLLMYKKELSDTKIVNSLLESVRKAFYVFFILASIEFILNNIVSPTLVRDFVISIVGTMDKAKTYYPEARFGYYGITVFFAEQSYVSVLLIYYTIVWKNGINNNKDLIFYILSIAVLFMSGCSTGVLLIPFALIVFFKEAIKQKKRTIVNLFEQFFIVAVVFTGVYLIVANPIYFAEYLNSTIMKVGALLNGGTYTNNAALASGATRNYANGIAMNAFLQSPFLGVGIGGTRGYGVFSGLLATFGLLGIGAFVGYLNSIIGMTIRKKIALALLLFVYLSVAFSVWYVYMLAFIPLYLVFQDSDRLKNVNLIGEDNVKS